MSGTKKTLRFVVGFPPFFKLEVSNEGKVSRDQDNLIHYGDRVAIRTYDGWYWQTNRDNGDKIMALAKHVREWETFQIVAVGDEFVSTENRVAKYNDKIALRFISNDCFIGSDLNNYPHELMARVPWVKEWEAFEVNRDPRVISSLFQTSLKGKFLRYGSAFSLRAYNGRLVSFDKDESKQMLARSENPGELETFFFRRVPEIA